MEESWVFGMLWPKRLRIFEDRVETSNVELLRETVETTEYDEVKSVSVGGGSRSTNLLIHRRGGKPILMRGIDRDAAAQAKRLIEERAGRFKNGSARSPRTAEEDPGPAELLRKLAELRGAGVITEQEFEIKRRALESRET